jgi:hypothetical protein
VETSVRLDPNAKDPERDALAWILVLQCWPETFRRDAFAGRPGRFAVAMHPECWRAFGRAMWVRAGFKLGRPR